jgi:hypothetical protein
LTGIDIFPIFILPKLNYLPLKVGGVCSPINKHYF